MRGKIIITILKQFGFTRLQAVLFYAGYKIGPAVMAKLARAAKIPRSSAYYVMDELLRRRFFATKKMGGRIYYLAASNHQLINMVRQREQLVKKLIQHLTEDT